MNLILIAVAAVTVFVVVVALIVWRRGRDGTALVAEPPSDLKQKLSRSRIAISSRLGSLIGSGGLDDSFWEELEEALIAADVGVGTAARVTRETKSRHPEDGPAARAALEDALVGAMSEKDRSLRFVGDPAVVLVVGVNGTGKTTSIAKLAARMGADGRRVILAAADTFRAAADDQLRAWAERVGVDVVTGEPGSDPAAVAFETYQRAAADGYDTVIVDTAGRLHSKSNLMSELGKVARVLRREAGEIGEVLLVLDGTTGQNSIGQARSFTESVGVTGIVMTKLDGTARGGIAVAVEHELGIPVKFIGVGEGVDDLIPFDPADFIGALLEP
ncbi:MAG: hypothetical protein BMS9Abin07_1067 [Acidimicrobiia bacterium]|nr:MAG: hypothetical protein BMS9Abin07_1067 [Acidimicrobiia bacterium]